VIGRVVPEHEGITMQLGPERIPLPDRGYEH
jgi:hypothetical protein